LFLVVFGNYKKYGVLRKYLNCAVLRKYPLPWPKFFNPPCEALFHRTLTIKYFPISPLPLAVYYWRAEFAQRGQSISCPLGTACPTKIESGVCPLRKDGRYSFLFRFGRAGLMRASFIPELMFRDLYEEAFVPPSFLKRIAAW
jgi:hypothetical protein